jgi:hypothetical protein
MSVASGQGLEDLHTEFLELESKVLHLIQIIKEVNKRLDQYDKIAKKNGIDISKDMVEGDTCTIN